MKLSIVCPALTCRSRSSVMIPAIDLQCRGVSAEFLVLQDNGQMILGDKLNLLYQMARGDYIACVADDDVVPEDYVASLIEAIERSDADAVTFNVDWQAGEPFLNWPPSSCGLRPIAAVRASIAKEFRFPSWWQSEDRAFRTWLTRRNPSIEHIDRILYRYVWVAAKPEYGGRPYPPGGHMATPYEVAEWVSQF